MKLLLVILLFFSYSCAVLLDCNYYLRDWVIGMVYVCGARVLDFGDGSAVVGVTQNHLPGKTDNDVTAITFYSQPLKFVPQNIHVFFKNMRLIHINNTTLSAITSNDLKPFPKLEAIGCDRNLIKTIDGDLFIHNPLLLHINLRNNYLTNIGPNIFTHLQLLRELYFGGNLCIIEEAKTFAEVRQISLQLAFQCPPSAEMIERIVLHSDEFEAKVDTQIAERINPVVYRVNQNEIEQIATNEELKSRILELEKMVRELNEILKK